MKHRYLFVLSLLFLARTYAQECKREISFQQKINMQAEQIKKNAHFLDAVFRHDRAQAKKWLTAGASVDAQDASGNTALESAAQAGDKEMVEFLVDQGAYITPHVLDLIHERARREYQKYQEEEKKIRQTFKELVVKK